MKEKQSDRHVAGKACGCLFRFVYVAVVTFFFLTGMLKENLIYQTKRVVNNNNKNSYDQFD